MLSFTSCVSTECICLFFFFLLRVAVFYSNIGGTFVTYQPTTGEVLCEVAAATSEDVNLAVAAARVCMESESWGYKSTGAQRAEILRKLGTIIERRKDELASLDSMDQV